MHVPLNVKHNTLLLKHIHSYMSWTHSRPSSFCTQLYLENTMNSMCKEIVKIENSTLYDVSIPYVSLDVNIVFELHIVSVSQVIIEAQSTICFSI